MKIPLKILLILILLIGNSCKRNNIVDPLDEHAFPSIPSGFNIFAARDGAVGLEWDLPQNQNHKIIIYRSINDQFNFQLLDSSNFDFYIDTPLEYDSTYFYKITSKNTFGEESSATKTLSALPKNLSKPSPPPQVNVSGRNWEDSIYIYINWYKSESNDVAFYEIYRDTLENVSIDSTTLLTKEVGLNYTDTTNIALLTTYYYKIVTVDKGLLKSSGTLETSDFVLDLPEIISPSDNQTTKFFDEIKIKTVSLPANYKILFQSNPLFGTVTEINLYSEKLMKLFRFL